MPASQDPPAGGASASFEEIKELTTVVQHLIKLMGDGNIRTLDLSYGALQLTLQANDGASSPPVALAPQAQPAAQAVAPVQTQGDAGDDYVISAPMIGTFYVAPAPNEPPFVLPGDEIAEGQTIGIIEAMKIMNEIASDRAGTVVEVIASDGQTVEYGSPLVRIAPASE